MSKNSLEVYKIGTSVRLTEDITGTVNSIHISGNNDISYDCGWWNGRSYTTQMFHANSVLSTDNTEKIKIGFA